MNIAQRILFADCDVHDEPTWMDCNFETSSSSPYTFPQPTLVQLNSRRGNDGNTADRVKRAKSMPFSAYINYSAKNGSVEESPLTLPQPAQEVR
tara:strand:+ start:81 stop:362 length:282 start_codon:yes stop_codon:yes gene_type:complete